MSKMKADGMLEAIWEIQAEQQRALGLNPEDMGRLERDKNAKEFALGLYEEVGELIRTVTHFKAHILKTQSAPRNHIIEEVVDVMKMLISLAQLFNVTPEELYEGFLSKTEVVKNRAEGQKLELEKDTKLIISDLDGCIADISGFTDELSAMKGNEPINDQLVGKLEGLKEKFYRQGGFRDVALIPGSKEALDAMRKAGYKIVIITARPYWQYKRIYADTLHWLQKHDIPFDLILYNKDKAEATYEHIFPAKPEFFIEDRDKHALEMANIGVKVLLLDTPINRNLPEHPLIRRVKDWSEIVSTLEKCKGKELA